MNPVKLAALVFVCLLTVFCAIGSFLMFPGFALNGQGVHGEEIPWNGGFVKVVDYSGIPGIHMNYVEFYRPGERVEWLLIPHQHKPTLSVLTDGGLRAKIEIKGRPGLPSEGDQVVWNGDIIKVVPRETTLGRTYFVERYRGGKLIESVLDMGKYEPQIAAYENGVLTAVVDIPLRELGVEDTRMAGDRYR